ncbi:hypothetical protein SAMN05216337_1006163 [Bradyrhizobium brasilense]|uniref:Uncharacterized protein n=1 Tax=Bradyrhizobium brasilense TaxID=1419277 RepID=A0A1G6QY93_9BRAD|nr:hypothetical protein SAMN05216337_1006163 [Bradyrhizobium brasilense]
MAKKAKKQTARGRKQDRARVAGRQDYEMSYESRRTRKSAASVKRRSKWSAPAGSGLSGRLGVAKKKSLGTTPSR